MKKRIRCLALLLFCMLLCACGPESDIMIHTSPRESRESGGMPETTLVPGDGLFVIINKNSKVFHVSPDCIYAARISAKNRLEITVRDSVYLYEHGYSPCGMCSNEYKEKIPEEKS